MPASERPVPSLTLHKASGRGVVRLDGKDIYCGAYGTPECQAQYHRVVHEWLTNGRRLPEAAERSSLTINELVLDYLNWADGYYVKDGEPTTEPRDIRHSIQPLIDLYGLTAAREFGPLQLEAVRQAMLDSKSLCRNVINQRIRRLIRIFKWGVAKGRVPSPVVWALEQLQPLKKGRSQARETKPIKPVPDAFVDAVRPFLPPQVWAMIELQRLAGMRPQEVCMMRTIDIDTTGRIWAYVPESHKTEHHEKDRTIYFGPRAQAVLRPWLRTDLTAALFQPREAMEYRYAERRARRKTKVPPSQADRRKAERKRAPGDSYDTRSYYHAVRYAIQKANAVAQAEAKAKGVKATEIPAWHPNQLRHNAATRLRREFGLEAAKAVLGHSSVMPTQIYAERDEAAAMEAMAKIG